MAIITLRVDETIKEELEDIAARARISVSELARQGIDTILGRATNDEESSPLSRLPTPIERATLGMLHQIMAQLDVDEYGSAHHQKMAEVLERGYVGEYGHLFHSLDRELPLIQCQSVWDVLDLFRTIKASLSKFTAKQRNQFSGHETEFAGFDANSPEESRLLGYAQYLIADGRWRELSEYFDDKHENGNSHHTTLPRYRAMVSKWHQIQRDKRRSKVVIGFEDLFLSPDEIEMILEAGRLGKRSTET